MPPNPRTTDDTDAIAVNNNNGRLKDPSSALARLKSRREKKRRRSHKAHGSNEAGPSRKHSRINRTHDAHETGSSKKYRHSTLAVGRVKPSAAVPTLTDPPSSPPDPRVADPNVRSKRHWTVQRVLLERDEKLCVLWEKTLVHQDDIDEDSEGELVEADGEHHYIVGKDSTGTREDGSANYRVEWDLEWINKDQLDPVDSASTRSPSLSEIVVRLLPEEDDPDYVPPSSPLPRFGQPKRQAARSSRQSTFPVDRNTSPGRSSFERARTSERPLRHDTEPLPSTEHYSGPAREPTAASDITFMHPDIVHIADLRFQPTRTDVEYDIAQRVRETLLDKSELKFLTPDGRVRTKLGRWVSGRWARQRPVQFRFKYITQRYWFNGRDLYRAEAVLVQRIGYRVRRPCSRCASGKGPFDTCVVLECFGNGECTNCRSTEKFKQCSFHADSIASDARPSEPMKGALRRSHAPTAPSAHRSPSLGTRSREGAPTASQCIDSQAGDFIFSPAGSASSRISMGDHNYMMSGGLGRQSSQPDGDPVQTGSSRGGQSVAPTPMAVRTVVGSDPPGSIARSSDGRARQHQYEVMSLHGDSPSAEPDVRIVNQRDVRPQSAPNTSANSTTGRKQPPVGFVAPTHRFQPGEMTDEQFWYVFHVGFNSDINRMAILKFYGAGLAEIQHEGGRLLETIPAFFRMDDGLDFMNEYVMKFAWLPKAV